MFPNSVCSLIVYVNCSVIHVHGWLCKCQLITIFVDPHKLKGKGSMNSQANFDLLCVW